MATVRAPSGNGPAAIPDSVLSHVFAYDSATQSLRLTADSGGPPNGVRFLLAQVDALGRPVFPLTTAGWFDTTDLTPAGGPDSMGGMLVGPSGSLLHYSMVPTGTTGAYTERLEGRFGGAGSLLAFRDSTARVGTQVSVTATLDDTAHHVRATLVASRTATDRYDWFYTLDFTLRFAGDSIRVKGSNDVYCLLPSIGMTVLVHDSSFAAVTNGATPDSPSITRGDGNPVTAAQTAAVLDLMRLQGELFKWMETFSLPGSLLLGP